MERKNTKFFLLICSLIIVFTFFAYRDAAEAQTRKTTLPSPTATPKTAPSPTKKTNEEEDVIRIESKLVVVPVSVSDAKGALVKDLQTSDFSLSENGKLQEIERLSDPGQVPLDIALLIDVSGSINQRFAFQKEAAERFLRQVFQTSDRVSLFSIDQKPVLIQSRTDLTSAVEKLKTIQPARSTTAFFDTVAEAAQYLQKDAIPGNRRVIIVLSDGEDTYSEKYLTAALTIPELQRADTLFYSINPGGGRLGLNQMGQRGQDVMQQMAAVTGGLALIPETDQELDATFRQIALELRSQYLLQYYSSSETAGDRFVPIRVQIPKRPDLRIRARQGYYPQPVN